MNPRFLAGAAGERRWKAACRTGQGGVTGGTGAEALALLISIFLLDTRQKIVEVVE